MEQQLLMQKLKEVELHKNVFQKVIHAETVQELIDLDVEPEEFLSYITAAEELSRMEDECILFGNIATERLKAALPVKSRKHVLFM